MNQTDEAARCRKLSVMFGSLTATMAVFPAVLMSHGPRILGFACIGVQVALLVLAIHFLTKWRRLEGAGKD
jgi:hypothetical protein